MVLNDYYVKLFAKMEQKIQIQAAIALQCKSKSFCDCRFPNTVEIIQHKGNINELCDCKCLAKEKREQSWLWDNTDIDPADNIILNNEITFHPIYSQGTSIITGNKRLEPQMLHYWEIQLVTCPLGTDLMFGIGTDKVNLNENKFKFVSGLGNDDQSWAYSYRGIKAHKQEQTKYGRVLVQGALVSVYLDLCQGTLEFFINRKSLGIAFRNIPTDKNINLYPMIASTSSRCAIRLCNSTSQSPKTLQLNALNAIKNPQVLTDLKKVPGLKLLFDRYWFLLQIDNDESLSKKTKEKELNEIEIGGVTKRSNETIYINQKTRKIESNDLYSSIKLPIKEEIIEEKKGDLNFFLL